VAQRGVAAFCDRHPDSVSEDIVILQHPLPVFAD
jgi:hypothetical protein